MADPYLSEIKVFSFNFAPKGWAMCNGQLLAINQNQALFALLGTTYGGNGQTTFGLPDLRGRIPLHRSNFHPQGQAAGEEAHTLSINELPAHNHTVNIISNGTADQQYPASNTYWAAGSSFAGFHQTVNTTMDPQTVVATGGSQPHQNMAPYLALNFCIALVGIFPSRT